jgi:hypothetical protein
MSVNFFQAVAHVIAEPQLFADVNAKGGISSTDAKQVPLCLTLLLTIFNNIVGHFSCKPTLRVLVWAQFHMA